MMRPKIQFRVLIIGRANAGKTSILQRVCDTTESPEIYRNVVGRGRERVSSSRTSSTAADLIISLGSTGSYDRG